MLRILKQNVALIFFSCLIIMGNASAKEQKIGMVDSQYILEKMPQMLAMESTLRVRFKDEIDELEKLQVDARANYEKLQRDRASMSSKKIEELSETLLKQKRELENKNRMIQGKMREDFEFEKNQMLKVIARITKKVAKEEGYDYIFRSENLAYAVENKHNISAKVLAQAKKIN